MKIKLPAFLAGLFIFGFTATQALAGGGPIEFRLEPNTALNPGEQFIVHARVSADGPQYPAYCKNCYIKLAFKDPQDGDYIAQNSDKTDEEGRIYAKVISKISGIRTIYASELKDANGNKVETNSSIGLKYNGQSAPSSTPVNLPMPGAPEMVYPQDGQTLDLEGAYMFKVRPVDGASGYLFGLFQDGVMTYENYRDHRVLSSNGEFAVWESDPFHAKFHIGPVQVWVRAYVRNQWTDARIITINLKPRQGGATQPITRQVSPGPEQQTSSARPIPGFNPPEIRPSEHVLTVTDSSASAALQKRIDELQQKLEESQQRQSVLEQRLNQIISWIKSVFPFFK